MHSVGPNHVTGKHLESPVHLKDASTTTFILKRTRKFQGMLYNLEMCLYTDSYNETGANEHRVMVKFESENEEERQMNNSGIER
jgi:hypothetical protein